MNLLGKIFIVLILVMSLLFMGFAVAVYGTHKNWQAVVMRPQAEVKPGAELGLKFQLENARAKNKELQAQYDKLRGDLATEQANKRQQLAKLETEREQLKKQYADLNNALAQLKQGQRTAMDAATEAQKALDARVEEIRVMREQIAAAYEERDQHFTQVVTATDALHQAQGELQRLQAEHQGLENQVAKAKVALDRHGVDPLAPADGTPLALTGYVLKSSADGLIEISLGSDEGVVRGQQLIVYRKTAGGETYVGKVEILQTLPEKSVAKVMPQFRRGTIEREDLVATRLK